MTQRRIIAHDHILEQLERLLEANLRSRGGHGAASGQRELGRRFKLSNTTICHWKGDGIPARHWPRLLEIADAMGFPLSLEQLAAGSPLCGPSRPGGVRPRQAA